MGFSFIHCGDLHLGCFPNRLEERYLDFFNAFENVINYAINNEVKLLLISGDLFHLKAINSKTLQKTIDALKIAQDNKIEVIVIEGNHDKAFYVDEDSWLYFLNNQGYLKLLQASIIDGQAKLSIYDGANGAIIECEEYRIIGLGYMGGATEKYLLDIKKLIKPSDKFTILLLHAAVNRLVGQDMGDVKGETILELKDKVDYVALGHIHNQYIYNNYAFNPGALENIRLKDGLTSEEKGFFHVTVNDDKSFDIKHINSNPRFILNKTINVTGLKNPAAVEKEIIHHDFKLKPLEMLNLSLVGKLNFNPYMLKIREMAEDLKTKYNLLYVEINNNINIATDETSTSGDFDFSSIVKNLIIQEIKFNDPNSQNCDYLAQAMIDINDLINEENEPEKIENYLMKLGEKL